jgi:sigma-B regulation protein RsbU (phosphoserine phosphatase)
MESDELLKLRKEVRSLRKQVERLEANRATFELMSDRNNNLMNRLTELAERERQRLARDAELAREIQIGLLPKTTPVIPGYEIAGWSQAAAETGGDYFDWLVLADGRLVASIADAAGHGIGPALLVTACRAYFRAAAHADEAIEQAVARVNDLLALDMPADRFVTAAVCMLDPRTHGVRLYSAGHGPQFFYCARNRLVEGFAADELPLGVHRPMEVGVARLFPLEPGDSLLLITDGFYEWHDPDGDCYGTRRLSRFFTAHHDLAPDAFIQALHADVLSFSRGTEQCDDLTAVVIKRIGRA